MNQKVYTTLKIYFIVKDIDVFETKYDNYFNDLECVYQTGNHTYEGKFFCSLKMTSVNPIIPCKGVFNSCDVLERSLSLKWFCCSSS